MTDDEFGDLFAQIGPIRSHNIIKNKTTKESLGYGFVDFRKEEDAERALSELHSSEINGKILKIQYARKNHTPKGWSDYSVVDQYLRQYGIILLF